MQHGAHFSSDNQVSVPKVTHGTSPVLVNASSVMELYNDEDKGRHILVGKSMCYTYLFPYTSILDIYVMKLLTKDYFRQPEIFVSVTY